MKIICALAVVSGIFGATIANGADPSKAATSDLPAALQMLGVSQDSVVSKDAAHKVRGQLFLGDTFDFNQLKTFAVTGAISNGTTTLLEGTTANYHYSLAETVTLPDVTKTITLLVDGQFAGLGGGIGVNNDTANLESFGSLSFAIGGKFLNEDLTFQGAQFNQNFQQNFGTITPPPGP